MGKSFDIPAFGFISDIPEPAEDPKHTPARPIKETMSRRLNILIKPSLFHQIHSAAESRGISINALVNKAVEEYLKK